MACSSLLRIVKRVLMLLFACLVACQLFSVQAAPPPAVGEQSPSSLLAPPLVRVRRQFDLKISANHDDKDRETEVALEAIANLWRSKDRKTQVEGSARVIHRSNSLQAGANNDWRLGVSMTFN